MKLKTVFSLLWIMGVITAYAGNMQQNFDRASFYGVLATGNTDEITMQLEVIKKSSPPGIEAFEGALLMKKAGFAAFPGDKLSLFKSGRKKLESAILKDDKNGEFRFLRLVIQEHAPGIVNYRKNLEEDGQYVRDSFKTLLKVVQDAVRDYSKKSKILRPADF